MGIFGGFWPYSQKVMNAGSWNLVYRHIVGTFKCVWKMGPVAQILGPKWPPIGPKLGQKSVFHLICYRFPPDSHENSFLSLMELLQEVRRIWAPRGHFFWPFLAPNMAKIRSKLCFLTSLLKVSIGFIWNVYFKLTGTTLRSKKDMGLKGPFFWPFLALNMAKSGWKWVFWLVCRKFPLSSYEIFCLSSLELL